MVIKNLSKQVIDAGGKLIPLVFTPEGAKGTGLMNASVFNDDGKLLVNVRYSNYTLWHSENQQLFNSCYGPLIYYNPENDCRLVTTNYVCTFDKLLNMRDSFRVRTEKLDNANPLWEFHGLEDARLFRWDNKLFLSGVRRDTTPNGEGRMELSEVIVTDFECTEITRQRIPMPEGQKSYCEKNWVPILDWPYHYVKWTNPTEIIHYDPIKKTTTTVIAKANKIDDIRDPRGGSQVIPYKDYHIALVHDVNGYNNVQGQKDATYRHRFAVWDKDWDLVHLTDLFDFMDAQIEFACGLCLYEGSLMISFGFQDNAAFLLQVPEKMIDGLIGLDQIKDTKIKHIFREPQFGEDWFTYPKLYTEMVNKATADSQFVEVGCWKGKSSAYMATEIANSGKNIDFYCVDKWDTEYDTFIMNMKSFDNFRHIKGPSVEVALSFKDRSLDFVFIDASHEYADVKADILAWAPKVKIGGILAGHDYHEDQAYNPGVYKAVNELLTGFTVSEMCWIYEVKETKLEGMPSVYCLSLEESTDRRENLLGHFKPYLRAPRFCLFKRYAEGDVVLKGSGLDSINIHAKGSNISNLLTIKAWYDETKEDYGFICEDDLSLETVQYWGFTWQQFIDRLPLDWECAQLIQVRDSWSTHKLKVREPRDFCNAVYIIKRAYAKFLIDTCIDDKIIGNTDRLPSFSSRSFKLECENVPIPENILFRNDHKIYSIPLFVEDVPHTETTFTGGRAIRQSEGHQNSYNEISNFWRDNGSKFTVQDFTPLFESWREVIDPIFEITTNILTNGCAVNCVFCPQKTLTSVYKGERMLSLTDFKTAVDKIPIGVGIIFAGLSEPWLNANCTAMIVYANFKGHKISIFTTGLGMTIEDVDVIKSIPFASGPNRGFTLHVPDTEGYANHAVTDKYITLLEYIRDSNIAHLRVVSMGTVPERVKQIFPEIQRAQMFSRAGNIQKEEQFKPELANLRSMIISTDLGEGQISCISPEGHHHSVMLPNGDVSICCQDYELKHIIGNIFTQEYKDIIPPKDTPFALCRFCENGKTLS
jgi:hypothetical protein